MKNSVTEELVQAIEKLPEDKKRQVAEFISKLDPQSKASPLKKSSKLTPAQIAEINAFTERMCEKSKQYPEFDVLEVMEAIRR